MQVAIVGDGFIGNACGWRFAKNGDVVYALSHREVDKINNLDLDGIVLSSGRSRGSEWEIWSSQYDFASDIVRRVCKKNCWLVYVSSQRVHGWEKHPVVPCGIPDPLFGEAKLRVEQLIAQSGLRYSVVRPSNVYGPQGKPFYNSVLATWIDLAARGKQIEYDEYSIRSFVHIDELSECIYRLSVGLHKEDDVPQYVECSTIKNVRLSTAAKVFCEVTGSKSKLRSVGQIEVGGSLENKYLGDPTSITRESSPWSEAGVDMIEQGLAQVMFDLPMGIEDVWRSRLDKASMDSNFKAARLHKREAGFLVDLSQEDVERLKRVYAFGVEGGFARGNHYHKFQLENFYVLSGSIYLEQRYSGSPVRVRMRLSEGDCIVVKPGIVHTFWNPKIEKAMIMTVSDQEYIEGEVPDTYQDNHPSRSI